MVSRIYICVSALLFVFIGKAQDIELVYEQVRPSELRTEQCSWVPEAIAEVLFDQGVLKFEKGSFEMYFERRIRLKSYEDGLNIHDMLDLMVPKSDKIQYLRAERFRLKQGRVDRVLTKKIDLSIDENELSSQVILIPSRELKKKDILEISYTQSYEDWRDMDTWWFQNYVPTAHSELILRIPEYFEFELQNPLRLSFDVNKTRGLKQGEYDLGIQVLRMDSIPPFVVEPYSSGAMDYRWNIGMQLNEIHIPEVVDREFYHEGYEELVKDLASSRRYGRELRNNPFLSELTDSLVNGSINGPMSIYGFVQESIRVDDGQEFKSVRAVHTSLTGNSWDVNRYLIALLNESGNKAYPLLISSTLNDQGTNDPLAQTTFDRLICALEIHDGFVLLNASDPDLPFGFLRIEERHGSGLLIDAKRMQWLDVEQGALDKELLTGGLTWKSDSAIIEANSVLYDYAVYLDKVGARTFDRDIFSGNEVRHESIASGFEKGLDRTLRQEINVTYSEDSTQMVINPLELGGILSNPFTSEFRLQPVEFPAPLERRLSYSVPVPEGWKYLGEELFVDVGLPSEKGQFRFTVKEVGKSVQLSSQLTFTSKTFYQEEYAYLKALIDQVVQYHSQGLTFERIKKDLQ